MMGGEANAQLAERVANIRLRLEQAVTGSLTAEAWDDLWTEEGVLEGDLLDAISGVAQAGGYGEAGQLWQTVADLNDRLATIAAALINRLPDERLDAEALETQRQDAAGLALSARAQAQLLASVWQRLSGSPAVAAESAEAARRLFESAAEGGQEGAAAMALVAEGYRLGSIAAEEQFRLQYADAALTFLQAKEVLERVRTSWLHAETDQQQLAGLAADISAFETAHRQALLALAISAGNFDDAVQQAEAMVALADSVVRVADLTAVQHQLAKTAHSQGVGLLAYVRAEIAANNQDWRGAEQQLVLAADEWLRTVGMALNTGGTQGRHIAEVTQAQSAQALGACRRRIARERSLYATITKLEAEKSVLQQEISRLAARPTFTSERGGVIVSEQHAGRDIVGGDNVGGDKTTAEGDVVGGDKITAGGDVDFSQVWQEHASEIDLSALAEDLKTLRPHLESSGAGERDAEIAAVAAAQLAASEGDGPMALKWLKSAGKWVLDGAVEIGAAVASAAARAALGV